jgi:hypothetical protein
LCSQKGLACSWSSPRSGSRVAVSISIWWIGGPSGGFGDRSRVGCQQLRPPEWLCACSGIGAVVVLMSVHWGEAGGGWAVCQAVGGGVRARQSTVVWAIGSRSLPLGDFWARCAPGALVLRMVSPALVCIRRNLRSCGVCAHGARVGDPCRPVLKFCDVLQVFPLRRA